MKGIRAECSRNAVSSSVVIQSNVKTRLITFIKFEVSYNNNAHIEIAKLQITRRETKVKEVS